MSTRRIDTQKFQPLYTVAEAADLLLRLKGEEHKKESAAGQRWLRDGVNHKGFPHYRVGRRLMFTEADLVAILEDHCRVAATYRRPRRTARKPATSAA